MKHNNTNLKPVPKPDTSQLTWNEVDRIARAITIDLGEEHQASKNLMLLMHEISTNPFDHSYVESIANLLAAHLFGASVDADRAFQELMDRERGALRKGE